MKRLAYSIVIFAITVMSSCDKIDHNGDLYGMWQLLEWRDASGNVVANKEDMIFYSFQLQMARFDKKTYPMLYMLSSMEHIRDRITIYNPINYKGEGHDSIYSMSVLQRVGVPENGEMVIYNLSDKSLVLTTESRDTLIFRKY